MMVRLLLLLLETVFGFFTYALLARFALQWARAPFRNPIGQFVIAVTDWLVRPARRIIPSAWGLDLPSLILAWLSQCIYLGLAYGLTTGFIGGGAIATVAQLAAIELAQAACHLAFAILIVSVIISWVNPHAPLAPVLNALAQPMLRPFQRLIPPVGGIDLSPLAPFLIIQGLQIVLAYARSALLLS
ncbi:MAG: YggT family protein [Rhodocyclaceae bacterium]|nr:YggT family protein [Rhodocyclaceae bacterium]